MQEEQRRFKVGTIKHSALEVLHAAGPSGLPIAIMDAIQSQNLREAEWDAKSKRVVQFVSFRLGACHVCVRVRQQCALVDVIASRSQALSSDPAFVRLEKGIYALACLVPDAEPTARAPRPLKKVWHTRRQNRDVQHVTLQGAR